MHISDATIAEQMLELGRGSQDLLVASELEQSWRGVRRSVSRRASTPRHRTCISATRC